MPKISVLLTCYNQEHFIEEALRSVLDQTVPFHEVIVVDDCSTDGSIDVIENLQKTYPSLVLVRNASNLTIGPARNRAVQAATGDYVWMIDGDDWIEPHAHSHIQTCFAHRSPELLIVNFKAHNQIDKRMDNQDWEFEENHPAIKNPSPETDAELAALLEYLPPAWVRVVKRDFLISNDIYFEPMIHQDILWTHQCHLTARDVVCTEERLVNYRIHASSILRKKAFNYHDVVTTVWDKTALAFKTAANSSNCFKAAFERNRFRLLCISLLQTDRYEPHMKKDAADYILSLYSEPPGSNQLFQTWFDEVRTIATAGARC